jgi:ADP-ribosylglycohydrolase
MTADERAAVKELDPDRAYGALIGQAVGDALGAPTERNTRRQIADRYGWVDDFVADDPVGTDDTEFAVLTAQIILRHGRAQTVADMTREWVETLVQQQGGFHGAGFSEMTAINNLRAGLTAPLSGRDNHEMWSDGSAMRITPVGVFCAGAPIEAARRSTRRPGTNTVGFTLNRTAAGATADLGACRSLICINTPEV